ncbi:MAG: lactonase family protein [Candidatus Binataceae bacterium]
MPTDADEPNSESAPLLIKRAVQLPRMLRWAPLLVTIGAMAALAGSSCGRSIFPKASSSASPTSTSTPGNGNYVYLTNFNDGKVSGFSRNLTTGALTLIGTTSAGSAKGPYGLVAGNSGKYLYVANASGNNSVFQYSIDAKTGKLTTIGSGSIAAGASPRQIAIDHNDAFAYVTNFGSGSFTYYAINSSTGALGSAASQPGFSIPFGVTSTAVNAVEFLYVADEGANQVLSFQLNSGVPSAVGAPVAIADAAQMATDSSGAYVFVVSPSTGVLYQLSTSGGALALVSFATTGAVSNNPTGVAVANPSGGEFIYTANQAANSVSVFTLNSVTHVLQLVNSTTANLSVPTGVAVDPSGAFLYVTNNGNGTVAQFSINATTGALTPLSPGTVATESGSGHGASGPANIVVAD